MPKTNNLFYKKIDNEKVKFLAEKVETKEEFEEARLPEIYFSSTEWSQGVLS